MADGVVRLALVTLVGLVVPTLLGVGHGHVSVHVVRTAVLVVTGRIVASSAAASSTSGTSSRRYDWRVTFILIFALSPQAGLMTHRTAASSGLRDRS